MHGDIRVAAADPPDSMRAKAGGVEKSDLPRPRRLRDIEDAPAGVEWLFGLYGIRKRFAVVVGLARILLHGPDIRAIDREQDVAVNLKVVGAGILWSSDERHRGRLVRVANVDHRKSVAEHVADK